MSAGGEPDAPLAWRVVVEAPLPGPLTYLAPEKVENSALPLMRGQSVTVPLGRRRVFGTLLGPAVVESEYKLKNIIALEADRPSLHEPFIEWLEWLARYYIHPPGQVFSMAFPPLKRAIKKRKSRKAPLAAIDSQSEGVAPSTRPQLTDEQLKTITSIQAQSGFAAHLVHGVTGSGKTEIYMHLLEQVIARGQQGLVLVPEISLTPQLIDRFTARLGEAIAVIHSHLTPREKTEQWWAMLEGKKQILIGARSALFCPIPNLGMIVVDEEHEASFKQEEGLKYHARDAAIMLGKFSNCAVVLGSATPSLESWQNAALGRYALHSLKSRVADRALPDIQVVDLRTERETRKLLSDDSATPFWCSDQLYTALDETLNRHEQAALFLNRRGIAQAVVCPSCGWVPACPNCEVKLTLHGKSHLLCHYCDYHESLSEYCRECKEGEPKPLGIGTELIERDLARLFPSARILRMDRDEISTREELEASVRAIELREVDLIVGTQMIAKGLDFPGLTFVGLVMADVGFHLPDFRAGERSFQLLTQVAGRSGRHLDHGAGRVLVQTYNPDHPSLQFAMAHDYLGFAKFELEFRQALHYPPFWRLAGFRLQGLDLSKVTRAAKALRTRCDALKIKHEKFKQIEILGPAPSPIARLRNQYRWQMLIKAPDAGLLGAFCRTVHEHDSWLPGGVRLLTNIDAVQLL